MRRADFRKEGILNEANIQIIYENKKKLINNLLKIGSVKEFILVFDEDQDGFLNEDEQILVFTIIAKRIQVIAEELLLAGCSLEESGWNNLVGVNILQWKWHTSRCYDVEFLFHNSSLGSVITPVIAAAAAVSGDARMVRAPGPWRPSKLRFEVLTLSLPAGILSSFIARHAEHPG